MALFLLKKQDVDIYAVAIDFLDNNKIVKNGLNHDTEKLKAICAHFGVSLYGANLKELFKSEIIDKMVLFHSMGKSFDFDYHLHHLILNGLYERMIKLDADYIVTGHYAETYENSLDCFFSSKSVNDQSHLVSTLRKQVLEKLSCPLGPLSEKEVLRIFDSIFTETKELPRPKKSEEVTRELLTNGFNDLCKEYLPKNFIKSGSVIFEKGSFVLGHHDGIYKFKVGEKLSNKFTKSYNGDYQKRERIIIHDIDAESGKVICRLDDSYNHIFRAKFLSTSESLEFITPIDIYLKFRSQLVKAKLFFKSVGFVEIYVESGVNSLGNEKILTIYDVSKRKKVLGALKFIEFIDKLNDKKLDDLLFKQHRL